MIVDPRYCVYRHIRPDKDEPFYIGIGKIGNNRQRDKRRNTYWEDIVNLNNNEYIIEILFDDMTLDQASEKEKEFIVLYGRIFNNSGTLANILPGGAEYKNYRGLSKEDRAFLSEMMKGQKRALGYRHTADAKERMSLIGKSRDHSYKKGVRLSEETKNKMSESHKGNISIKGKIFINDGTTESLIYKTDNIPDGWTRGTLRSWTMSQEGRSNVSKGHKGMKYNLTDEQRKIKSEKAMGNKSASGYMWVNNGVQSSYIKAIDVVPDGWNKGRIYRLKNKIK